MRRLLPFVLVLLFVVVEDARAVCGARDVRVRLREADAAFDGRFVSERHFNDESKPAPQGWERRLTFRVDRVIKGQLSDTVEIVERGLYGGQLSGTLEEGERVALLMRLREGAWSSSDCDLYDPEELADAAEPLPRPPGRGRAAFVVHGVFGDATLALLDRKGRTLAYGFGDVPFPWGPHWSGVLVCPGGGRIVEAGNRALTVRRTRDLRLIRTIPRGDTMRAHCLRDAIFRATPAGLFRGKTQIWAGELTGIAFHQGFAFVKHGDALSRVDLRSGRERAVATLGPTFDQMSVSPDGRWLGVLAFPADQPPQVVVVDLRSREVRTYPVDSTLPGTPPVWLTGTQFALTDGYGSKQAFFFDPRQGLREQTAGWGPMPAFGHGGALFGMSAHRLERGTPSGHSVLGRLPGSVVVGVERLPGVEIRASRRLPRF